MLFNNDELLYDIIKKSESDYIILLNLNNTDKYKYYIYEIYGNSGYNLHGKNKIINGKNDYFILNVKNIQLLFIKFVLFDKNNNEDTIVGFVDMSKYLKKIQNIKMNIHKIKYKETIENYKNINYNDDTFIKQLRNTVYNNPVTNDKETVIEDDDASTEDDNSE